jgi:hypothetical protein
MIPADGHLRPRYSYALLTRRPGELPASEHVEVEVRDGLAGDIAVVHDQAEVVGDPALSCDAPDRLEQLTAKDLVLEVRELLHMLSRHHKDVEWRARKDVVDRHDVVVLIDDGRRDLSGHDAAEQAVVHAAKRIPTCP